MSILNDKVTKATLHAVVDITHHNIQMKSGNTQRKTMLQSLEYDVFPLQGERSMVP